MSTQTILVESSDGCIWNRDTLIIEMLTAINNDQDIIIDLNDEGPCAETLGLYNLLDQLVTHTGYNKDRIEIVTSNAVESSDQYRVTYRQLIRFKPIREQMSAYTPKYKTITDKTKHFASFVGHGSRYRLAISGYLHAKYKDKVLQSYHTDIKDSYFREFLSIEDLMYDNSYSWEEIDQAIELLKNSPLTLDPVYKYPMYFHEGTVWDILNFYSNIFIDIVYQPFVSGNTFFIDEKICRAIMTKTPFIVHGPQNFLNNLKVLGFKTFSDWWDEGYSEDPPDYQVKLIKENIDNIATWDTLTMEQSYNQMKPILDHNYSVLASITNQSFKDAFA
jgi:hypothetical protein